MSEQIALASTPQRGMIRMAYDAINRGKSMTRREVGLATGLKNKQLTSALNHGVERGFLERDAIKKTYKIAPAVVRDACAKIRNEGRSSRAGIASKSFSLTLPPHIVARLDAEVEDRKSKGKKASRSEVVRLALLAYKRPPIKREKRSASKLSASVLVDDVAPKSTWWKFWE